MAELAEREVLVASLRGYLEDLLDTGVTELIFGGESAAPEVAVPAAAPAAPPTTVTATVPVEVSSSSLPRCRGVGNPRARLAFVMHGAGFEGEAGALLAKMVQAMGFAPEEVFLLSFDAAAPASHKELLAVLHKVDPEAVMALGEPAAQLLLESAAPLSELRGAFAAMEGAPVMPTWHPEALLTNQALKREAWHDMQQVMHRLGKTRPA